MFKLGTSLALLALAAPLSFANYTYELQDLSSFVDNSGVPHIVFMDYSGDIHNLYYQGSTNSWIDQNLASFGVATNVHTGVTTWVDHSGSYHVAYVNYVGNADHIMQAYYYGGTWVSQDVTAIIGGTQPNEYGGIWSWVDQSGGQHIGYGDRNLHVSQVWYASNAWHYQDLTQASGGYPIQNNDSGGFPTPYLSVWVAPSGSQHIAYQDDYSRINQIIYSGTLSNQPLTPPNTSPLPLTALTTFVDANGGQHIGYFANASSYPYPVNQLYWNGSTWVNQNLSAMSGSAGANSVGITSFTDGGDGMHIAYFDDNGDINLLTSYGGTSWSNQNVTAAAGGPTGDSPLTSFISPSGQFHIVYASLNPYAHICQYWWTGSKWVNQDLTAFSNGAEINLEGP
jgi:hypothetical protein